MRLRAVTYPDQTRFAFRSGVTCLTTPAGAVLLNPPRSEKLARLTPGQRQALKALNLGPATIARGNHIFVRYLHRLFHDQGTSVARWVRERRLANCRRDLEDPALAQRGVQAIARRWGFEDPAHFSKIFKASYGDPPGAYRQRADAASRP